MSVADNILYEQSLNGDEPSTFPFTGKSWLFQTDSNGGGYGHGQINFNVSELQGERWYDWAAAEVEIPIQVTTTGTITAADENALCVSLKNGGALQLIHSMSVHIDNQEVIKHTGGLNIVSVYKLHCSLNKADYDTVGPELEYYPDNLDSQIYSTALGVTNNHVTSKHGTINTGMLQRAQWAARSITDDFQEKFVTDLAVPKLGHAITTMLCTNSCVC